MWHAQANANNIHHVSLYLTCLGHSMRGPPEPSMLQDMHFSPLCIRQALAGRHCC